VKRAIFLDKDGTLVEDVPYNVDLDLITLSRYAAEGLELLQRHGYALFVVSNQPGLAHGMFSDRDLQHMLRYLHRLLQQKGIELQGFYYCPHSPDGSVPAYTSLCTCRKPMPGLIQRAARDHALDVQHSWMVGDILNDVEAGRRAGCKTVLINNGNETEWQLSPQREPHIVADNLYTAAKAIILTDRPDGSTNGEARER
jgi:D-glycero-D-manno-heptose 1,7-bisphosphate phosphatase